MPYEKLTPESPEAHSESPVDANVAAIAELFPSIVQDGQVDFDALRTLLGDAVEPDENERFGLHWHGKKRARWLATQPSLGTLRPCREESLNWDTTKNLYIEGDNLEVLKLLRRSYSGRVKMIYIDPPYNTGKDFVYTDDYRDNIENYKKVTKQEGKYSINRETDGRYHTEWLNMMYPRLLVARDLLTDDGIIFISIDDNEVDDLKKISNEIFGETNYFALLTRRGMHTVRNSSKDFNKNTDYVLVYAKNKSYFSVERNNLIREKTEKESNYPYNDGDGKGFYKLDPIYARDYVKPYTHTFENGIVWAAPEGSYPRYSQETLRRMELNNELDFKGKYPRAKRYFNNVQEGQPPDTLIREDNAGFNQEGTKLLASTMGHDKIFSQPKPAKLIKYLITLQKYSEADIILDFFSGSATTAHAVMQLNAEDGGNRRFIMVQLPERCDEITEAYRAGYENICEIGKERIRRAGRKIKEEAGLTGQGLDVGFRVYKLDSSNVRAWNPEVEGEDLLDKINQQGKHLVAGRTGEDFLTEIMLKCGIDILEEIEEREIAGHRVQSLGYGQYYACMDEDLASDAEQIALGVAEWHREEVDAAGVGASDTGCVVFVLDQAFEGQDAAKMNFVEILKQYGISNVKAF